MTAPRSALSPLHARIALTRIGWLNMFAIAMLLAGLIGGGWLIYFLQAQVQEPVRSLQRAEQALRASARSADELLRSLPQERVNAFYDVLGDRRYAEQQIKTLFAVAAKNGLTLAQGEYRATYDKPSRLTSYQVSLPVRGSYEAIRLFCEQALLAAPFASLDDIAFKRDAIANRTLEAKVRFTLYLGENKAQSNQAAQPVAATGDAR